VTLLGIREWVRVVILTTSYSATFLSQLGRGRVYSRSGRECRMLGRVGLCNEEVSFDFQMAWILGQASFAGFLGAD